MQAVHRISQCTALIAALLLTTSSGAWGDGPSTGASGINSEDLGLTGAGIAIGQVERDRPGLPGFDDAANSHPDVIPDVFLQDGAPIVNANTSNHAEQVAGVMVSADPLVPSVAPDAALFASADAATAPFDPESALSAQHIARQNGGDVRAINLSFGNPLQGGFILDGNSLLSQFVDFSARQDDVLYVVSGNEDNGGAPVPTDNFNGITVGHTQPIAGVFRQVNPDNLLTEDAVGARRSLDLVAPGTQILMPQLGGSEASASGPDFAAPHVTATVALLQEMADTRIAAVVPNWDSNARRHEVMKAVLMNSADKLGDAGNGLLLGMTRTVLDTAGADWLASDAFTDETLPLDDEMGTGQLHAQRAGIQFGPGEHDSFGVALVPVIGWDFGATTAAGDKNVYVFDAPLRKDSYVSVTLAWDREVSLNDTVVANGTYDSGESFTVDGLTNLSLYLLPKDAADISERVCGSTSAVQNVEHLFCKIPDDGEYEIWVVQEDAPLGDQEYGLAWWAVAAVKELLVPAPAPGGPVSIEITGPSATATVNITTGAGDAPSAVAVAVAQAINQNLILVNQGITAIAIDDRIIIFGPVIDIDITVFIGWPIVFPPPPPPPPISPDHYLCYAVKDKTRQVDPDLAGPPDVVNLQDQFDVLPKPYRPQRAKLLCTPVNKNGVGILDIHTHLKSYKIKRLAGEHLQPLVLVATQFGGFLMHLVKETELLVPTAKDPDPILPGFPLPPHPAQLGYEHFKCYRASLRQKFPRDIVVELNDQFGFQKALLRKPRRFCAPVSKNGEPIHDPFWHLTCFGLKRFVRKDIPKSLVATNNQFGPEFLQLRREKELCVPSLKIGVVLPIPTTTPTPTGPAPTGPTPTGPTPTETPTGPTPTGPTPTGPTPTPPCVVGQVEFEAINSPLDANPNEGGGQRIFVGDVSPTDPVVRHAVRVRATLTLPLPGETVYFAPFDVDDPSADTAGSVVDANDTGGVPHDDDNRGRMGAGLIVPNFPRLTTRGGYDGHLGTLVPFSFAAEGAIVSTTTDASGEATRDLLLTFAPGDNFRVAASCSQAQVEGLRDDGETTGPEVPPNNNPDLAGFQGKLSPMLTVWRRIHLEFDSMGPADNTAPDEDLFGVVTDSDGSGSTALTALVLTDASGETWQPDDQLIGSTLDPDSGDGTAEAFVVVDSTATTVTTGAPDIRNNAAVGDPYTIDTDDVAPPGAPPNPVDIDKATLLALLNQADMYPNAYIQAVELAAALDTTDDLPWDRNFEFDAADMIANQTKDVDVAPRFWAMLVLSTYDTALARDNDVDAESSVVGFTPADMGDPATTFSTAIVYRETSRDQQVQVGAASPDEEGTAAHELTHSFGCRHAGDPGEPDDDIMATDFPVPAGKQLLNDGHINEIRTRRMPDRAPSAPDPS